MHYCVSLISGSYHCLCPSQSSPTLWTTACWCTGSPSEPPQPETLYSATAKRTCSINIQHKALRHHSCRIQAFTLMKVSISVFLRLARASISTWQMAHIYRWFTAGPPPKLGIERPTFNREALIGSTLNWGLGFMGFAAWSIQMHSAFMTFL